MLLLIFQGVDTGGTPPPVTLITRTLLGVGLTLALLVAEIV